MSEWNVSEKLKNKIIKDTKNIDINALRFLYLLRNLGPQGFEDLINYSGLSRSTVSKYLKQHLKQNSIEKRLVDGRQKYCINRVGIEKLNDIPIKEKGDKYSNELNKSYSKLSELHNYLIEIGVEESIIVQIVRIISKIGDIFFKLEQSNELFLTLFYIFLNSVSTPDYKFELNEFCKQYNIRKSYLVYFRDRILSSKLGFFMFTRSSEKEDDHFFFHEEDLVGITTLRLVKDKLIDEIIYFNLVEQEQIGKSDKIYYDLDKITREISNKLEEMGLIWERIKKPFEMLIEKIVIKTALDMGISKYTLLDMVREKISSSDEIKSSLFNIIDGSEQYEDLNLVSIYEIKKISHDDVVKVKGFCPNCGKSILPQDYSKLCPMCEIKYEEDQLLKDHDKASEKFAEYKERFEYIECPGCEYKVKPSWISCPNCNADLK
jgi:predicted transcriptional regulator